MTSRSVPDDPGSQFATRLRAHRRDAGLSQEALALASGISVRAVSDLERGVAGRPRPRTVQALAGALGLSVEERSELTAVWPAQVRRGSQQASTFGALLRARRLAVGSSQEDLARAALVSTRAVSDLERGVNRAPRRRTAELLADALGLDGEQRTAFLAAAGAAAASATHGELASGLPEASVRELDGALPEFAWPILGRDDELAELAGWLRDPAVRLVTVTGPGGVGKTRLVAEAAGAARAAGLDVVFVPLQAARTPADVLATVAAALEVEEPQGPDVAALSARLRARLEARATVLVLDNVEQVPGAGQVVAPLLGPAAGTGGGSTVLVTSRVLLRLQAERELRLGPLPVPGVAPDAEWQGWASLRLFVQRAAAASPGWAPAVAEAGDLVEICRRVDGLPLALELVAPWVRVLPLRGIRERLAAGFDLVSAAYLDVEQRHRSLDVVLTASHDLLDEQTRVVFRRLSVFAAAFDPDTAETVCEATGLDVLAALAALRDASLLVTERDSDGEQRLRYLETVREFAGAALEASGEGEQVRARHARATAQLAATAAPRLVLADQALWLARLDRGIDDLRVALGWLLREDAAAGVRMCADLWRYWYLRGLLREGLQWLHRGLAAAGADGEPAAEAGAEAGGEAVALALYGAGVLTYLHGDTPGAERLYRRALAAYTAVGDSAGEANVLNNLGMVELYRGDVAASRVLHERALVAAEASGNVRSRAVTLANLAKVAVQERRPAEGAAAARTAMALFTDLGDARTVADLNGLLAECALAQAERAAARELWQVAATAFAELGDRPGEAPVLVALADLDLDDGLLDQARERFSAALAMAEEMDDPWTRGAAAAGLARHALEAGDPASGRGWLETARASATRAGDADVLARVEELAARLDG